jgi:glutamine amidotransferase
MRIAIVKYNAGNTRSVLCALRRLGYEAEITDDARVLSKADRVIFPGVGEAFTAMAYLREKGLDQVLKALEQPFLGVCLGLQLMCQSSEERNVETLGIFDARVRKFSNMTSLKIPHMGWNTLDCSDDAIFTGLQANSWCYFVHSYYVEACDDAIATTTYGSTVFASVLRKDNFLGCQFHPEKSAEVGQRILKNFVEGC